VTLEDVVEEIVGDIADEHDPRGSQARRRRDGAWSVSGLLRPDEVASVSGVALPEHEDYDTVAGLFLQMLGRMPERGDEIVVPLPPRVDEDGDEPAQQEAVITVERLDGLRIDRLALVTRSTARPAQEDDGDE
jgi:CBS domain containing-hemolysin-like protein